MIEDRTKREITLNQIMRLQKTIKCIYDTMDYQNNKELEKELLSLIKKENKLLESLNIKEEDAKIIYNEYLNVLDDSLYEKFKLVINTKHRSFKTNFNTYLSYAKRQEAYENEIITERFKSYILKRFRGEPVRSKSKYGDLTKAKENIAIINYSAITDYNTSIIKFLTRLEEGAETFAIGTKAIQERNKLLLTNKTLEEKYFNDDFSINGYEKCLANNQKKEHVDYLYNKLIAEYINQQSTHCYLYSNDAINDENRKADFAVDMQILKAGLYLLSKEDLKRAIAEYKEYGKSNDKESIKQIRLCLEDTKELKEKESAFQLKKAHA